MRETRMSAISWKFFHLAWIHTRPLYFIPLLKFVNVSSSQNWGKWAPCHPTWNVKWKNIIYTKAYASRYSFSKCVLICTLTAPDRPNDKKRQQPKIEWKYRNTYTGLVLFREYKEIDFVINPTILWVNEIFLDNLQI